MTSEDTLPKLLKRNYDRYGDKKVAMRKKEFGIWHEYTWADYYNNVKDFSLGLISLGLKPKERVAVIGDNDHHWYWAELATQAAFGVPLGIFTDCTISEVKFHLDNSDAKFVVAKDQEQVDKILALMDDVPNLVKVIYWDAKGLWSYEEQHLISFDDVIELGRNYGQLHPGLFEDNVEKGNKKDIALISYTSGTSALPKGVLLTHNNLLASLRILNKHLPIYETDQYLSFVPPGWAPEQWFGVCGSLHNATTVNFPENAETSQANLREISPNIVPNPPRLWEAIAAQIQALMLDSTFLKKLIYDLFLPVGYRMADLQHEHRKPTTFWKSLHWIAEVAVFRTIKDFLGLMNARLAITSGGALSVDNFRFLRALGIQIKQGYALTEGGAILIHQEDDVRYETVGRPWSESPIKISDEGEVVVGSEMVFAGYSKDQEATDRVLKDGWFHTGDAGYFDTTGHLIVIDRVADLSELTDGTKYSPLYIEGKLKFTPYIRDAVAIGGKGREYITAIISIDFENVSRWAEKSGITFTTFADLSQRPEVLKIITREIQRANKGLPEKISVKRFVNLYKEFDADESELTRTRKIRRTYTESRYEDMIAALYGDDPEFAVETEIRYRDGRIGKMKTSVRINHV